MRKRILLGCLLGAALPALAVPAAAVATDPIAPYVAIRWEKEGRPLLVTASGLRDLQSGQLRPVRIAEWNHKGLARCTRTEAAGSVTTRLDSVDGVTGRNVTVEPLAETPQGVRVRVHVEDSTVARIDTSGPDDCRSQTLVKGGLQAQAIEVTLVRGTTTPVPIPDGRYALTLTLLDQQPVIEWVGPAARPTQP